MSIRIRLLGAELVQSKGSVDCRRHLSVYRSNFNDSPYQILPNPKQAASSGWKSSVLSTKRFASSRFLRLAFLSHFETSISFETPFYFTFRSIFYQKVRILNNHNLQNNISNFYRTPTSTNMMGPTYPDISVGSV